MPLGKGLGSLIPQQKKREEAKPLSSQDRLWHIPISEIVPNSEQPRRNFSEEELADLVASIKQFGVLQPITVTEREDGGYELIAGERRLRACARAGLATIPAIVRGATQQEKLELALIENVQRQNLNPIEEAFAYARLMDEFHLKQEDVALRVGKSRSVIANGVRLLDLPPQIQQALIDGRLGSGKARAILSLKDPKDQLEVFAEMIGEKATVRDIERAVSKRFGAARAGTAHRDPNLQAQERLLEDRFGVPARITKHGEKGTVVLSYYSQEELKRLLKELI